MASGNSSQHAFLTTSALLFLASAAVTIAWSRSMAAMAGMPMAGGWTMSMMWMRMPGQTWCGATSSFLGMWLAMMAAMMLPSLVPMLARYRRAVEPGRGNDLGNLTAMAGLGYFFVWTLAGLAVFPLGIALGALEMRLPELARSAPLGIGAVIIFAGAVQFTSWKSHHLAGCREMPRKDRTLPGDRGTAFRVGMRFGVHCSLSCANLTAILLVSGLMDLRLMALVTAAITAERLATAGTLIRRSIGVIASGAGILAIAGALIG